MGKTTYTVISPAISKKEESFLNALLVQNMIVKTVETAACMKSKAGTNENNWEVHQTQRRVAKKLIPRKGRRNPKIDNPTPTPRHILTKNTLFSFDNDKRAEMAQNKDTIKNAKVKAPPKR